MGDRATERDEAERRKADGDIAKALQLRLGRRSKARAIAILDGDRGGVRHAGQRCLPRLLNVESFKAKSAWFSSRSLKVQAHPGDSRPSRCGGGSFESRYDDRSSVDAAATRWRRRKAEFWAICINHSIIGKILMTVVHEDRGDVGGRCTWSMSTVAVRSNSERARALAGGVLGRLTVVSRGGWWERFYIPIERRRRRRRVRDIVSKYASDVDRMSCVRTFTRWRFRGQVDQQSMGCRLVQGAKRTPGNGLRHGGRHGAMVGGSIPLAGRGHTPLDCGALRARFYTPSL